MTTTHHTNHFPFPSRVKPTLSLLRRRLHLSREVVDDVVRARGHVTRLDNRLFEEHAFFDRKRHGFLRRFGTVHWETPYIDGKQHGLERGWRKDGTLEWTVPYVENAKHGMMRCWRSNGTLSAEYSYVHDKYHGLCRWYNEDGSLDYERRYFHGEEITSIVEFVAGITKTARSIVNAVTFTGNNDVN